MIRASRSLLLRSTAAMAAAALALLSPGLGAYEALAQTIVSPAAIQPAAGPAVPVVLLGAPGLGPTLSARDLPAGLSLKAALPGVLSLPVTLRQEPSPSASVAAARQASPQQIRLEAAAASPAQAPASRTELRAAAVMGVRAEASSSAVARSAGRGQDFSSQRQAPGARQEPSAVSARMNELSKGVEAAIEAAGSLRTARPETAHALGGQLQGLLSGTVGQDAGSGSLLPRAAAMGSLQEPRSDARLQPAQAGASRTQAPATSEQEEVPGVKYAPRFWTRVMGAVAIAHGFMPVLVGLMGFSAGAGTALAVGASLIGTGLMILAPSFFRPVSPKDKAPNEGPFIGFTFVMAGFWNSVTLAQFLTQGAITGNGWALGVLYAMVGLAFMGMDSLKSMAARQPAGKAKSATPWLIFAGYIGAVAAMILLKDWHDGLGVLVGFGGLMAVILAAYVLPNVVAWLAARLPKGNGGVHAPQVPAKAWDILAANQKALVWGGGLVGALISLVSWALSGPAVLAAAPIAGVMLGFYLHQLARARSKR